MSNIVQGNKCRFKKKGEEARRLSQGSSSVQKSRQKDGISEAQ